MSKPTTEIERIHERYGRRTSVQASWYHPLQPSVYMGLQERQRAILSLLKRANWRDLSEISILEVGCGAGANLAEMVQLGARPENIMGVELQDSLVAQARSVLPVATTLIAGDACETEYGENQFDLIIQSTVFSSILDDDFQVRLASRMWDLLVPGGAILWYDFTVNNPKNPDVRGVPLTRVKTLFPEANFRVRRVTLAPPISRRVCRYSPFWYTVLTVVPWLKTHQVVWLEKPTG